MRYYLQANLSDFVMQVNLRKHCHRKLNLETDSPNITFAERFLRKFLCSPNGVHTLLVTKKVSG